MEGISEEPDRSETQHTAECTPGYPDAIETPYDMEFHYGARGPTPGEPDASGSPHSLGHSLGELERSEIPHSASGF